jgi:hypothetical protein
MVLFYWGIDSDRLGEPDYVTSFIDLILLTEELVLQGYGKHP